MYGIPDEPRADLKGRIRGRKEALDAAAVNSMRAKLVALDCFHSGKGGLLCNRTINFDCFSYGGGGIPAGRELAALAESRALVMVDENHGADEPIPDIFETLDEMLRQRGNLDEAVDVATLMWKMIRKTYDQGINPSSMHHEPGPTQSERGQTDVDNHLPYFDINPFECHFRSGTRDSSLSAHRREDTLSSMRATVSDVHGEPTADSRLTVLTSLSRICHLLVKAPSSTLSIEPETFGVCQASQTSKLSSPHMTARSWAFGRRPSDRG
ncbi:hypothetical protein FOC4_g10005144 [Fusarium odoratissimum]|uniref:Uncharacterized protein n=1 Tax=Fusarium oxysporum f. sp. cubense (strain race 4) TaxID=2502994 RepID=N1S3A7_FUSC4|nr:hypothetical protein FOC4_g10005144 [Fusarium odoratissimum]